MSDLPAPSDLILVVYMPTPRDMEIARLLGWYRIPLRSAPKVVAVDYLAFYQPASFGDEHKWRIETVAAVRGHEMATRAELLKDEPDHLHAREEYFKVQIGPLLTLPRPILAQQWKRILFLYTTGERLLSAKSLKDLAVRAEERNVLWSALRERARAAQVYVAEEFPEFPVEPELLALLGMMSGGLSLSEE